MITNINPLVLLIQETMMEGKNVEEAINKCVKDWKMESIDADENFGGIITAWIPGMKMISITWHGSLLWTPLEDEETSLSYTI